MDHHDEHDWFDVILQNALPALSAEDMRRIEQNTVEMLPDELPPAWRIGGSRPMLRMSAMALMAIIAGFCFGLVARDQPTTMKTVTTEPFYTGSGEYLAQITGS